MTTTTLTLATFLEARLSDDETAALAATPGPWEWAPPMRPRRSPLTVSDGVRDIVETAPHAIRARADATHIARHDPARVLAEVAAKRAVLANERAARVACGSAPLSERLAASDGPTAAYWRGQAWVLRILAAVYSDHPDYDLSWRL